MMPHIALVVDRMLLCAVGLLAILVFGQRLPAQSDVAERLFTELPPETTGVDFVNPIAYDHQLSALFSSSHCIGGVGIADFDGDGRLDLFCVGGPVANGLYLQDPREDLRFRRIRNTVVDGGDRWSTGTAIVDIDADGDMDIYVCNYDRPNQLFINRSQPGRPAFTEEAAAYGLDVRDASIMMTFADVDNDGDLDAYLLCNVYVTEKVQPGVHVVRLDQATGRSQVLPEYERYFRIYNWGREGLSVQSYGRSDYFFLNEGADENGQIKFRDVTAEAGIQGIGFGLAATWFDYDNDGWIDLHVANDFEDPDRFYRNLGPNEEGVVRFANTIADILPYTTWSSMGADVGDFNNDGFLDLLVADMAGSTHYKANVSPLALAGTGRKVLETDWPRQSMRNMLYLNTGLGAFQEAAYLAGLASTDWTWAVKAADYDLDGRTDVLFANGMSRNFVDADRPRPSLAATNMWEEFRDAPPLKEQNRAYRNLGDLRFEDVSHDWGFDKVGMSFSCAQGDLDNDGDLDVVVSNLDETVSIYRNNAADNAIGNWLRIKLRGHGSNPNAVGAVARVHTRSHGTLIKLQNPWTGWLSSNSDELHFGLGDDAQVERIEIHWPGNQVTNLGPTKANQLLTIDQSEAVFRPRLRVSRDFVDAPELVGPVFVHRENDYNDFKDQPLLPGKLSAFGPCMAWGDATGDGRPDVYIGGAKGQAGELWINDGGGRFLRVADTTFAAHAEMEDSAASWIDIDGDGDQDLMVASGSVEYPANDPMYRNRLYINRGLAQDRITPIFFAGLDDATNSSSAIAAADFDKDGDQDIFVGSRSKPGAYPVTPESQLLLNESRGEGIQLTDAAETRAENLKLAGLVTGAAWADVDGDGWQDLLVSTEWGPIKLWRNQQGRLVESTVAARLGERTGWWYGMRVADFDGDGDPDILALNVGLNTKYGRVSATQPAELFFGDMDDTGRPHHVEAKTDSRRLLPVRTRSSVNRAMPIIAADFPTHRAYASATLQEIYSRETLEKAIHVSANTFESGVWLNNSRPGEPRFEFVPLPRVAQISPAYDAAIADFDGDEHLDVFLAQNHFHREPETGVWRGGVGQLLRGNGDGSFTAVPPRQSGILLRGAATAAEAIDVDGDGDPDIVATQNNDRLRVFLNTRN